MTNLSIKEKILIARRDAGLTQEGLAREINVSTRTIARIEKTGKLNSWMLKKISEVTRKPPAYFISDDESSALEPMTDQEKAIPGAMPVRKVPVVTWHFANKQFSNITPPKDMILDHVYTTTKGGSMIALKVKDGAMRPEFNEGDVVSVQNATDATDGDFILALDNKGREPLLRQYKRYGKSKVLHPLNQEYQDIVLENERRYSIIGRVVGKTKQY